MANLTVESAMKVLKVEINHGLNVERSQNGVKSDYTVTKSSFLGAPTNYYVPKSDSRHVLDNLETSRRPYCIAVTVLIESPMKLFVQN